MRLKNSLPTDKDALEELLNETENLMIQLLEDIFGVKFEVEEDCTKNPYCCKKEAPKDDYEDWEKGTFKPAEVFRS